MDDRAFDGVSFVAEAGETTAYNRMTITVII